MEKLVRHEKKKEEIEGKRNSAFRSRLVCHSIAIDSSNGDDFSRACLRFVYASRDASRSRKSCFLPHLSLSIAWRVSYKRRLSSRCFRTYFRDKSHGDNAPTFSLVRINALGRGGFVTWKKFFFALEFATESQVDEFFITHGIFFFPLFFFCSALFPRWDLKGWISKLGKDWSVVLLTSYCTNLL